MTSRKIAQAFVYELSELPDVRKGHPSSFGTDGEALTIYEVGSWSFSSYPDEDGDIKNVEKSILAWLAWYEFLLDGGLNDE